MKLMTPQELEAALRDIGARRYHRLHPFHYILHGGKCTKGQVQAWALNRYYYQAMIPVKDASLIARCLDQDLRREWRSRLVDHDGAAAGDGGIERWLKLTDGLGLDRDYVTRRQMRIEDALDAVHGTAHDRDVIRGNSIVLETSYCKSQQLLAIGRAPIKLMLSGNLREHRRERRQQLRIGIAVREIYGAGGCRSGHRSR